MAKLRFDIWSMKTTWNPIPEIGEREMHHVSLAASNGKEWRCWGRIHGEASDARIINTVQGDYLWARAIAEVEPGQDSDPYKPIAGIYFTVTGVCHHAAMRISIPANGNVEDSPGNEIATPLFGRYGLRIADFVTRVEKAAEAANVSVPGSVKKKEVRDAISRITGGLKDEWEIVARDIDRFLKPNWPVLGKVVYQTVVDIYNSFYVRREALARSLQLGKIDIRKYQEKMRWQFVQALQDIHDLVGPQSFRGMMPRLQTRRIEDMAKLAANYVFFMPRIRSSNRLSKTRT